MFNKCYIICHYENYQNGCRGSIIIQVNSATGFHKMGKWPSLGGNSSSTSLSFPSGQG